MEGGFVLFFPNLRYLPKSFGAGNQAASGIVPWLRRRPGRQGCGKEERVFKPGILEAKYIWFGDVSGECSKKRHVIRRGVDA